MDLTDAKARLTDALEDADDDLIEAVAVVNATPGYDDAIRTARDLMSEHGENPEYDRGITELLADLYAVPGVFMDERKAVITRDLQQIKIGG